MIDDEGVLFNPFSVGPPNSSNRYEYEMPTATTYPPPVFATWPPPKEHANKSVSQGTLAEQRSNPGGVVFDTNSQKGQLPISKAINDEMTAAKQLTSDKERIGAGGESRTVVQRSNSKASVTTMKTLMSFRTGRSVSKSTLMSKCSQVSMAPSMKSGHSQLSAAKLLDGQPANSTRSKVTVQSRASKGTKATVSNTTLKSVRPNVNLSNQLDLAVKESDVISRSTRRSSSDEPERPKESRLSLRSKAGENAPDKVSRASVRSQADNISRVSQKSQGNHHEADNISRASVRTRASEREPDKVSRVSFRSKADEQQADNMSQVSAKTQSTNSKVSNMQEGNQKLKDKADTIKGLNKIANANLPLTERAELVKQELSQSIESSKSLAHKAAELSERLRAGNEFKHNRFHSLECTYKSNEPLKKCREDRISIWFKDAVLS